MKSLKNSSLPWVEKYRPHTFDEVVSLPPILKAMTYDDSMPNLMLIGRAGTGKTTVSRIIIDMLGANSLNLNASDERGIDVIRDKIKFFTMQRSAGLKIVFLDEADNITGDAQNALRAMMEESAASTRFILTGNNERGFIEPIKSRCTVVTFGTPNRVAIVCRLKEICNAENVKYEEDELVELVDKTYPDIRRAINILQGSIKDGKFDLELATTSDTVEDTFWVLMKDKSVTRDQRVAAIRQLLSEFPPQWPEMYDVLYDKMYTDEDMKFSDKGRSTAVRTIAQWAYQNGFAANKELNFIGCVYEVMEILGL
jgi:DNA polymerase III delta prime subunit